MTADLAEGLVDVVRAANRAVLLRETDLTSVVDAGDVDLLVALDAVAPLLDVIDAVAEARVLHYRLVRSGPHKIGVALYSADMAHVARIDLWIQLWQVFGGRTYLTYDDVADMLVPGTQGVPRLPSDLEAAVYVQHLAVKGRDPAQSANRRRLEGLRERGVVDPRLAGALDRVLETGVLDPAAVRAAEDRLRERVGPRVERRGRITRVRRLPSRWRRRRMERRALDVVALVGVDGSGKTSLGDAAAAALGTDTFLTKTAYRRSLLFRGLYKGNRLTLERSYEWVDDRLAPVAFLVAARRLPRLVTSGTVLDRYLGDLLVAHRKTDEPRFSLLTPLLRLAGHPCTIVHVRASWPTIVARKDEVSERGHEWYDRSMRRFYLGQPVYDYVAFRNDGGLSPAADALVRFVSRDRPVGGPP